MDIKDYRKVSQAFRRVSSNMLKTNYDDGNIQLIRFRRFIEENEVINRIIQDKIINIDYDYKNNFIVEDGGRASISIPIDESKHIKAMYDLIQFMVSDDRNFGNVFHSYLADGNLNERMKSFMKS